MEVAYCDCEKESSENVGGVVGYETIQFRFEQPSNALLPIAFTFSGIIKDLKPVQCQYLQPIITQYFIDNKSEIWLLFLIAHSKR